MKTLKLIAIFVGVLVAIVCAVLLGGGGGADKTPRGKSADDYEKANAKIDKEWRSADDWSIENFDEMTDWLNIRKRDLRDGYATLVTKFHNRALDCLHEKTVKTFNMETCSKAQADALHRDLSIFVEAAPEQRGDEKVNAMNNIYSLYSRAYSLAVASAEDFAHSPEFSRRKGSWYDFDSYKEGEIKRRDAIKDDPSYGYIMNISFISNGLDALEGKLDAAEAKFRESLASEIISAYKIDVPMVSRRLSDMKSLTEIPFDAKPKYEQILKDAKETLTKGESAFQDFYNVLIKFNADGAENDALSSFADEFSGALTNYRQTLKDAEKALGFCRLVINI